MTKENNPISKKILFVFCSLYFTLGIILLIKRELIAFDAFVAVLFCLLLIKINKKIKLNAVIAFLAGFVFMPHNIGNLGLYELAALNYHFDWIVHMLSAFISTIVLTYIFLRVPGSAKNFFLASLIALSITMCFGAVVECGEYWGFRTVGFGNGYLGFGEADNSKNYGPWENSSVDTSLNLLGSLLGVILYGSFLFIERRKEES